MQANSNPILFTLRRTIFLISMPFFILGLMLPIYGKQIGASVVEIGLFFSVFSLMTVILRPVVGQGISSSLLWLTASAITADLAGDQERGVAFGRITQASSRGASAAMLSPILITFLQEQLGIGVETLSWAFLPAPLGRLADQLIIIGFAPKTTFFARKIIGDYDSFGYDEDVDRAH